MEVKIKVKNSHLNKSSKRRDLHNFFNPHVRVDVMIGDEI